MHCTLAIYNKENAIILGEERNEFIETLKTREDLLMRNPDLPIILAAALSKEEYVYLKNKLISGDNFIYTQTIT